MAIPVAERFGLLGRRLLAVILDSALFYITLLPLMYVLFGPDYFNNGAETSPHKLLSGLGLLHVMLDGVLPIVVILFCWTRWGATPGKFLMGLRVVDVVSGGPITLGQSIRRLLGYLVGFLTLYIGFAWAIWDKRCRGWQDYLAGTQVVREPGYEDRTLAQLMENQH
jgi:uncharacterized RDD family membrane protein YckC